MKPKSLLIVEDLPTTLDWLTAIAEEVFPDARLERSTHLAGARAALKNVEFDLLLLDLGMPDGSGLELIEEIRSRNLDEPYIVVTTIFDDDEHLRNALRLGANGYLLKDDSKEDFITNLKNLLKGRPPISTRSLDKMMDQFRPTQENSVKLTKREEDVLRLIAKGYNVGQAAEMLELTNNTVKGYLKTVYSKLNISSRAEATSEAIKRNLVNL